MSKSSRCSRRRVFNFELKFKVALATSEEEQAMAKTVAHIL
jgi:hypothetical protein